MGIDLIRSGSLRGLGQARAKFGAVLVVLAFVLAVTFVTSPPAGYAAFPGVNGKIAFASDRDGDYEIYVMNADGSGVTQLTNNSGTDTDPRWSADGTKIAFWSTQDDPDGDIYVMNADGSGPTRLTSNSVSDFHPFWSPDGTKIAFISDRDQPGNCTSSGNCEIYVMNADGSGVTRLTNNPAFESSPAWSPDGTKIAFVSDRNNRNFNSEVYVMNADGSSQAQLSPSDGRLVNGPNWSPDGTKIAYGGGFGGGVTSDVFVINADGSGRTNLTPSTPADEDQQPAWSPDGTKIAFLSSRGTSPSNGEIYVMNPDGSGVTRLTNNPASDAGPDWQPLCTPAPSGLVSWWPLDGDANDIAGANNGTLQGGATFAAGRVEQAILLDGIDDFMDAGNDPSLHVSSSDFTVDTWVKFNALTHPPGANSGAPQGDMSIVDKMSAAGVNADGWRLIKQNDNRFWFCFGAGFNQCGAPAFTVFSTTTATTGVWFHVAAVKTSTSFSIYVNGVLQDSRSPVPAFVDTNTANLRIGSYILEGSHLNGFVDEVEIFNRALNASEILDIYSAGSRGKCKNRPPMADAGDDQMVDCTSPTGTPVMLDGSGSSDPDDDDLTYMWTGPFPEGSGTATGVSPTVTLPLGTSTITLVVNDGTLDSAPDTVAVTVKVGVAGFQPPLTALVPESDPVLLPDKASKQGRTLPLKLKVFCGTIELNNLDITPPLIVGLVRNGDAVDLGTVDLDAGQANDSGLLFRFSDGNWVYNLNTKGLSTGTYIITIQMPDGLRYDAAFVLR